MAVFSFGPYELDEESGELLHAGERIPLQPQPARLLGLLAERSGELVTREEIRERLWGPGTFVDSQQGINYCVRQVRQALGDEAATPRYVETIPRKGYRFLAPVEVRGSGPVVGRAASYRRALRWAALGLAVAGALLAAALLWPREGAGGPEGAAPGATPREPLIVPEEAHARYLEARYLLERAPEGDVVSDARRATQLLRAVIEEVPDHAEAHAALADAWMLRFDLRRALAMSRAESAAREALRRDPGLAGAHVALASTLFFHRLDWDGARASLRRALEIDPDSPEAVFLNGVYLSALGRHDEAIAAARRAARLDPARLPGISIAWLYFFARRYDQAVEEAERILRLDPLDEPSHSVLLFAHLASGRDAAADREVERFVRVHVEEPEEAILGLPTTREYFRMTWADREAQLAAGTSPTYLAAFGVAGGAGTEPLAYLRRACEERTASWDLPFVAVDPRWDELRAHPDFAEVVDCVGVPARG